MTGEEVPAGPTSMSARPIRTARIANASAAVALVVFVVAALLQHRDNAGAYFGYKDHIFTVVIGLIVAGGLRLPARPRMTADLEAVRTRGYLGNWRTIPWAAIVAVEFPSNVRFARLRLPGEETLAVYAIQRMDREYAVAAMRDLRALFAASRAGAS